MNAEELANSIAAMREYVTLAEREFAATRMQGCGDALATVEMLARQTRLQLNEKGTDE